MPGRSSIPQAQHEDVHRCAVCPRAIRRGLLMCYGHWRLVPRSVQDQVNRSWSDYRFGSLRGTPTSLQAYVQARQAAIDAVKPTAPTTPTRSTP